MSFWDTVGTNAAPYDPNAPAATDFATAPQGGGTSPMYDAFMARPDVQAQINQKTASDQAFQDSYRNAGYVPGQDYNGLKWVQNQPTMYNGSLASLSSSPLTADQVGGYWDLEGDMELGWNPAQAAYTDPGDNGMYHAATPGGYKTINNADESFGDFAMGSLKAFMEGPGKIIGAAMGGGALAGALGSAGASAASPVLGSMASGGFGAGAAGIGSGVGAGIGAAGAGAGLGTGAIDAATGLPSYALDAANFGTGAIDAATGLPSYALDTSNFASSIDPSMLLDTDFSGSIPDYAGGDYGYDYGSLGDIGGAEYDLPTEALGDLSSEGIPEYAGGDYGYEYGTDLGMTPGVGTGSALDTITDLGKKLGISPTSLLKMLTGGSGTGTGKTGLQQGTSGALMIGSILAALSGKGAKAPAGIGSNAVATPMSWSRPTPNPQRPVGALGLFNGVR